MVPQFSQITAEGKYRIHRVPVDGHQVVAYDYGDSEEVLYCLNGGPGLPCDYVRDSHRIMAERGYRVVIHDQLGTGASDRPSDPSLWTIERYVAEVETVRQALNLGRVHLLGQSWGTWLGLDYCLAHPEAIKTFTFANGTAEIALHLQDLARLRGALGTETVAMMAKHEAEGTTDHPEYQGAITILNYRHVCRLDIWPAALNRSLAGINMEIYGTMWGPNEFTCIGTLRDWDRLADLPKLQAPCLVLCGMHDELTPDSAARIHRGLPNSRLKVFKNSAHMPFFEEPEAYFSVLSDFLRDHHGRK
ncbi:proline iminopeptidase-family hydrolase [Dongia sedimenti]|uniref:Proline iminopeptidase-family hydrolase n=1 Tax=Dongia sedimenti TaxID=3064282 RepID=A0ABU0YEM7_9PROT|nr:proline iminopeptidase-family hydrolase [Rhodospirillaceae bacterium R-7]